MLFYFLITGVIALLLTLRIYLSITMPFWRTQPVFHFYDWMYWWRPPGIITHDVDMLNRHYNPINVRSFLVQEESDAETITVQRAVFLLQRYFLRHPTATYCPTRQQIAAYLLHNHEPSIVSVYEIPHMLTQRTDILGFHQQIIGMLTARPLWVRRSDGLKFAVYFVDNLCVHPLWRKQHVASDLIHTHYTQQRQLNPKMAVSLFKREGTLTHIVPLVRFDSMLFRLEGHVIAVQLPAGFQCLPTSKSNMQDVFAFIKGQLTRFDWSILPDVANIIGLLKDNGYRIFTMRHVHQIFAVYIVRDHGLTIDGKPAMECVMCLKESSLVLETFYAGWMAAVHSLQTSDQIGHVWMESLGDTVALTTWLIRQRVLTLRDTSPTAFFFYNYATHTVAAEKCCAVYWKF